ncbi:hypothetical protein N7481_004015 [Penicillium waksmanii]|uniref:uncharacterized protein n=1 Tax=Penicillium waksmanii TaxID=69791 RepID=UPI0025499AF7|nr:uncharacterized protein N7481_004015 [Penicillium waksmanii]KAJ5988805.1 hypothetical protein N7481_004015 [Penicillium waksmanii]
MPGLEVMSGPSVDSSGRPLFRSHKALPRRGISTIIASHDSIALAQPASPDQNATVTPAPPLTPPGAIPDQNMDDHNHNHDRDRDRTPRKTDSSASENHSTGMVTPRRPSKPPTPDVTPPRTTSTKRPTLNQLGNFLSSSSRAESFQTACENISSDGDMDTPVRTPRSRSVSQKTGRRIPSSSRQPLANGATMLRATLAGPKDKDTPQSASQPLSETDYETGFESFDGEWANPADGSPTPLPGKRRASKATASQSRQSSKLASDNDTLDVLNLNASLMREQTLRGRLKEPSNLSASPSMERFRAEIGWPSQEDPDSRRLSGISSTSTVEAVIIDSPKRAQRLLRHTEKRGSLRSASSPVTTSGRTSTLSNPDSQQHRLVHKAGRISEQDRRSISSDVSFSSKTTTSAPHASVDIIPVVVVPERRSSLRSGPNSHISSKPTSQRSSQRAPVPSKGSGSIDVPRQRKRTMSDSASARSRDTSSRGRPVGRPVIPPRSSSLSAPTSRNNSRATSLTSDSLRSHTIAMDLEMQKRLEQQPVSPPRHNVLDSQHQPSCPPQRKSLLAAPNLPALRVSSTDDMATLRPPSLPYTQWSIPSSSPGPVEIREATAISLFPHNNRSLLLVNQPRMAPETCVLQAFHNPGFYPRTPEMPTGAADDPLIGLSSHLATPLVDSPLKNPRPPPKPPVSKPLPPIPTHQQAGDVNQDKDGGARLGRRWNSVRRPWSARPRSESFNTITRTLSMRSAKNRTAGLEMDSNLHPFWRPRGFWDDIPGSPEKGRSARQSVHGPDSSLVVNNSLGLPQQRIIFDGPPSLARRSPEMRRVLDYNASRGSLVDRGMIRSPLYQHRYRVLPQVSRWGLRLRSMSLRNVRIRLRRLRLRRDERKRAARRETLKQSIGGPVYVASSTTNEVAR